MVVSSTVIVDGNGDDGGFTEIDSESGAAIFRLGFKPIEVVVP